MKKLSLLSVFVLALVMLFAFSVFADGETTESQAYVINKEHIESVVIVPNCNPETTINGEGSINNLFDGDCYSQTDYGWFPYHPRWIGKDSDNCGSVATITLREECLITSAQVYMWSNNNNLVNFKFYNAKGNETSSTSGPATIMDGSPVDLGGGFKVKTIVIETPAIRSQIWLYELVLNAEPLPPCTHDIDTCMDTFRVLTPATCNSDALIEYTCTECRKVVTASPTYDNIIQYALKSTIATSGAGGDTTSPNALFDGDEDSYLHASTNWFVQSEIAFNMNYYLHSVTVTVGSYSSNGSNGAVMTIWYKAPGATEWTEAGKIDTPIKQANTKYNYTLDFTTPVYASAIKVRIDGLQHSNGQAFEAKVAGSLVAEVGKLNHTWVKGETVAPTCVSVGYTNYSCSACEATKIDDAVAVDIVEGHTGGTATCTAKAVCSLCLKEYGEFGNHTYTNTIACITNKCVVCGYVNADVAAEKPHTYGWNIGTNENGEQMHGCSVCKTEAVRDKDNNNISTNLGFTIFYAQSAKDLTKTGYDVIRLCVDFSYKDTLSIKDPNVLIDFGGHSYTKTGSRFNLQQVKGLVNGTIYQNHGLYAIRVYCAGFIEDFDIVVDASYNDNASGIYMWYDASYGGSSLGYMKNVTIDSVRDYNGNYKEGRGLFNHGIEFSNTNSVIGTLENVKVYSRGQALTLYAKSIGKMTNCTFDGTNIALAIGNLQCNVELENCVVNSEVLAIYIEKASAGTKFEFDEKTTISSSGTAFYILPTGEEYDFSDLTSAVALVDGKLYTSFDAALAALKASTAKTTTFTLIGDLELDAPIEISKAVQFSLGGGKFKVPVINTKNFNEYDAPGYVLTAPNGAFIVKEGGLLTITGDQGTLVGGENAIVVEEGGSALIVAGTYDGFNPQNYMSSDSCYDIKDGKYTITKNHTYSEDLLYGILYRADGNCNSCGYVRGVARVGELYYATLEEAIAAAVAYNATVEEDEDKVSVELAVNIDLEKSLVVSDVVKIVLNGKTISASAETEGDGVFHVIAGGELTISDHTQYFTGTVNGVCASEYDMAIWVEGGKVIIEAGIFTNEGAGEDDQYDLIYVKGGELEIKGGTFLAQTPKWTLNLSDNVPGTITVTGGTFPAGFNPGATETEPKDANNDFIPYDYYLNAEGKVVPCLKEAGKFVHSFVESTCTEDGYCSLCGRPNEADPAKGHSYFYPCDARCMVCGEITKEVTHTIVHVAAKAPTCTEMGNIEYWYCEACGMAWLDAELIRNTNLKAVVLPMAEHEYFTPCEPYCMNCGGLTNPEATHTIVHVAAKAPTCTEMGNIEYWYCEACGMAWLDAELIRNTNLRAVVLPMADHTNTEIIPAVLPLPSNNHTGKTEGLYCLDCETTIVEQKVITVKELTDTDEFRFRGASLTLDENISINYSVPAGKYKQLYTVFIVVGKESEPVFKYTHDTEKDRYVFNFNGLNPQLMAENIVAYVYAETEDGFVMNKKLEYSIMEYCISQLKKASSTPAYKTLISNILELGAATQKYTGYKTDALVTDLVRAQGYTLTPTTFTGVSSEYEIANPVTGDTTSGTTWKSGSLVLGAATQIKLKFITDNTEGLVVKVNVAGKNYYFNPEELEMEGDRYVVIISTLTSVQYGEVVTATFERNGVQVGSTLTYSVNAYIYNKHDTANNLNERALLKVLYEYGTYVKSYYGY